VLHLNLNSGLQNSDTKHVIAFRRLLCDWSRCRRRI